MLSTDAHVPVQTGVIGDETGPFPNLLSEFVFTRTYARWVPSEGRRETWAETVQRFINFIREERPAVPSRILSAAHDAILNMKAMPSMRALWCAGDAARRENTCLYNCSSLPVDNLKAFSEALYILMQGSGVGFSVERQFIDRLPLVGALTGETVYHRIGDSTDEWADALYVGMINWFKGNQMDFDYSDIRSAGVPLKTKGGRASGPRPLAKLLAFAERTVLSAAGRKLKPIEAHDIMCQLAEIVMVGGFRRSSLISFSDLDDEDMRHAKDFSRGEFPQYRFMANNSVFYDERPDVETFWKEWRALAASGSGERGFSIDNWHRRANRPKGLTRTNPCGEIGLRYTLADDPWTGRGGGGQMCNLSAAVMRSDDTIETMAEKVRLATWLGVIQASFTYFPYLRPGWAEACDQDRLLGVDITGQCDNPKLSTDPDVMAYFNRVALETAAEAAAYLGINMPVAITCGKPSGNSSQFLNCASGFHPRHAPYYVRRVRINGHDPLFHLIRDAGVPVYPEVGQENLPSEDVTVWVAEFPVKAPKGAMTRNDETALQMCNRYLHVMQTWCGDRGHNQSATIYVRDHEWDAVGQWVYDHFDEITGLSFLPFDGGKYRLAPYEEISCEQFEVLDAAMPWVDFTLLSRYEQEDRGDGAKELACVGGSCEI